MGQLPKRRSLRLVCSKPQPRRDVHSMWEKSKAFASTPILPFTRPQSPWSKPIAAIHLPLLALPDLIGSHCKSTHHKYDLWRGFKNCAPLPKRRAGPSAVTASSTHEKACFSRSGCECCDLRTSQSCPRLARELSRAGAGGGSHGVFWTWTHNAVCWRVPDAAALAGTVAQSGQRLEREERTEGKKKTRMMELLIINRVNVGCQRNSSSAGKLAN